eukprot:scaffold469_cov160-Amphora_coffeaeformis.AAC.8
MDLGKTPTRRTAITVNQIHWPPPRQRRLRRPMTTIDWPKIYHTGGYIGYGVSYRRWWIGSWRILPIRHARPLPGRNRPAPTPS